MTEFLELCTTLETFEQAQQLAQLLVDQRLAACVQIDGPLHSLYRWQGKTCQAAEYRMTLKSTVELESQILDFISHNHPYATPQIVLGRVRTSTAYGDWLQDQVQAPPEPEG